MFYSKLELEEMADNINLNFFPERYLTPKALDAYDLLDALGCEVDWKYLSPDDSILGATFFDDGYWYIWPSGKYKSGDTYQIEFFRKGTIVINQILLDTKNQKDKASENYIVCHECAHWIKDQHFFMMHPEENVLQVCKKNNFEVTWWNGNTSDTEIIERQTNYLAAAILMPRYAVREAFLKISRYKELPDKPIEFKNYMKAWISTLSKMFGVNFNPMKYRLYDLEILSRN